MKKIFIIETVGILLFVAYLGLIITGSIWGYMAGLDSLIISLIFAVISIFMLYKGWLLRSYSTIWFAMLLVLWAIVYLSSSRWGIRLDYLLAISPIIPSVILIIMREKVYVRVLILTLSIVIPYVMTNSLHWAVIYCVLAYVLFIVLGIIISRLITFKEEKV